MLKIKYDNNNKVKEYKSAKEFVGNQQLEVPDFEDYIKIDEITLDEKNLVVEPMTMIGLFNYLISKEA